MRRNVRICLFVFTLMLILTPAFPLLAGSGSQDTLALGSSGERVTELQRLLQKAGFFPASQKVTGYFGWITYNAVTALEKKHGLQVNGQVGSKEWSILYGQKSRVVLGYYTVDYPGDRLSYNSLANFGHLVDFTAMFDFCVDGKGNLKGSVSPEGIKLAREKGARTLMVVHNISLGSFDHKAAYSAITIKANRNNLVDNIVNQVDKYRYDGVNIDFEGIPAQCRGDFNLFLEALSGKLKERKKLLTVAVPAKISDAGNSWSGAYDYRTIGRLSDFVVIMTYDEHWISGKPGPVASLPWVVQVLKYATGVMPSQKVLMGIGCYGYDWPEGRKGKPVKWKDMPALVSRYGGVKWDNGFSVPYMTYKINGVKHQVWFENRYSLAIKLNLIEKYDLGGIAIWRMGFEDASFWETLRQKL